MGDTDSFVRSRCPVRPACSHGGGSGSTQVRARATRHSRPRPPTRNSQFRRESSSTTPRSSPQRHARLIKGRSGRNRSLLLPLGRPFPPRRVFVARRETQEDRLRFCTTPSPLNCSRVIFRNESSEFGARYVGADSLQSVHEVLAHAILSALLKGSLKDSRPISF